uniref:Putative secreted salivary protein n=1 Tax=Xenopsylla cheopis TaxID=163159 RepID=A2IA86_XENCH|nr:putative secreted salivary protein [Xenopsylla cheopis]
MIVTIMTIVIFIIIQAKVAILGDSHEYDSDESEEIPILNIKNGSGTEEDDEAPEPKGSKDEGSLGDDNKKGKPKEPEANTGAE